MGRDRSYRRHRAPAANLEVLVGRWAPARPSSRFWLSGKASTSLAQLWAAQGRHAEAYYLLAPAYGWFTGGFDTADLKGAKELLSKRCAGPTCTRAA